VGDHNAPTVLNCGLNFRRFRDGRAASLEEQAGVPVERRGRSGCGSPPGCQLPTTGRPGRTASSHERGAVTPEVLRMPRWVHPPRGGAWKRRRRGWVELQASDHARAPQASRRFVHLPAARAHHGRHEQRRGHDQEHRTDDPVDCLDVHGVPGWSLVRPAGAAQRPPIPIHRGPGRTSPSRTLAREADETRSSGVRMPRRLRGGGADSLSQE
jgi:hypothetical protein